MHSSLTAVLFFLMIIHVKKKLLLGAIKANNALEGGKLLCSGAGLTKIIAALCGCLWKDENSAKNSHIAKIQ